MVVTFLVLSASDDHCLWYCSRQHIIKAALKIRYFHYQKTLPCITVSKKSSYSFENRSTGHCTTAGMDLKLFEPPRKLFISICKKIFSWIKVSNKILHFMLKTEALVTVVPVLWFSAMERATRIPSLLCIMQLLAATWSCISRRFSPYPLCQ